MIAAYVKKHRQIELRNIPILKPQQCEVLLQIEACGVCGSDYIDATKWARNWKRFGHEIVARVVKVGTDVTQISVGDQVAVALSVPCGTCAACQSGNPRKCASLIVAEQGGFAEYLLVKDERLLHKITPEIEPRLGIFIEPLSVVLDAFNLANLAKGDSLLVVGGGFIGVLAILTAKALGVHVNGVLSRSCSNGLSKCISLAGGEFIPWKSVVGIPIFSQRELSRKLSGSSSRLVVLHTAPANKISTYLYSLPFDTVVVNIGLSASRYSNMLFLNGAHLVFRRLQLMNAFPVPNLYMCQAISLLQRNKSLFSSVDTKELSLIDLQSVIKFNRKSDRKLLIVPKPSIGSSEIGLQ